MTTCFWKTLRLPLIWLIVSFGWARPVIVVGMEPDFLMDSDPELHVPEPVKKFDPATTALWMTALDRPEIDMQRMAAETIARAHSAGVPNLIDAVPSLEQILSADTSHLAARFAAARALIVLDSRSSEEKLFQASQTYGADLQELVEPALAQWGNEAAKSVWLERLNAPETSHRDLMLAIRGLGHVRDAAALKDLLSITNEHTRNQAVRLEAAAAAGNIATTGLEQSAERLAGDRKSPHFVAQICAIHLLARHSSERARQILISLANHEEPVVVAAALQRLNEIDPALVLPMAESAMQSSDPKVRRQGAASILRDPAARWIGPLCQLLADPHPELRRDVGDGLKQLANNPDLNDVIRSGALQILAGDTWQGQEQASLLLGSLEHQPAADRLVQLLESPRREVRVASAWALRKVAVPETIPALIDRAARQTEQRMNSNQPGLDEQVAHLFEALGVMQAADATPLLLKYVPKRVMQNNLSRGAAIWALGRINTGQRNPDLEDALVNRILDFQPQPYEISRVKQMSAIALARMRAVDQAPMLRQSAMSNDLEMRFQLALGWAVKELTGEEMPPPAPPNVRPKNWFLEPLP